MATIDQLTGLATAGSSGVTAITATATNPDGTVVTGTGTLTVTASEPLVALAIVPGTQQAVSLDQTAHFVAIGTTSSGTTVDLTNSPATITSAGLGSPVQISAASWISSNPKVADIVSNGVAQPYSAGTTAIVATATNPDGSVVTGTAALTVTIPGVAEPLVSMAIVPASQTIAVLGGPPADLTAIATTGTGTTVNLTNQTVTVGSATIQPAVWASSNPGVATVDPGSGQVTAVAAGTTAITAIAKNPVDGTVVTGTAIVTVTAPGPSVGGFASIAIIPGVQAVATPGATAQYKAVGTTTSGATQDLTNQVAWSLSSAQIGTISTTGATTGLATGVGPGTATVTAVYSSSGTANVLTGTGTFTVVGGSSETYTALTITPGTQSLSGSSIPPQTAQFVALATLGATGEKVDVTSSPQITWSSSVQNIASVSPTGLVSAGITAGSTTITAELKNTSGATTTVLPATANVTVVITGVPEPLLSLTIVPGAISVGDLEDTGQFLAIGTFSVAPYTRDLTNDPGTAWISSFPDSFPVTTNSGGTSSASAGIVTAYGTGTASIIAEYTNPDPKDPTIQTATATFSCPLVLPNPLGNPPTPGSCWIGQTGPLKSTLTVYGEGLNTNNWLITAPSATATPDVIHCGPGWAADGNTGGSVCTGIYPNGATVIVTAPARIGVAFGGWTYNCTPSDVNGNPLTSPPYWTAAGPNYCTISLTSTGGATNATVGAIFNNQ